MKEFPIRLKYLKPLLMRNGEQRIVTEEPLEQSIQDLFANDGYYKIKFDGNYQLWYLKSVYGKQLSSVGKRKVTYIATRDHDKITDKVHVIDLLHIPQQFRSKGFETLCNIPQDGHDVTTIESTDNATPVAPPTVEPELTTILHVIEERVNDIASSDQREPLMIQKGTKTPPSEEREKTMEFSQAEPTNNTEEEKCPQKNLEKELSEPSENNRQTVHEEKDETQHIKHTETTEQHTPTNVQEVTEKEDTEYTKHTENLNVSTLAALQKKTEHSGHTTHIDETGQHPAAKVSGKEMQHDKHVADVPEKQCMEQIRQTENTQEENKKNCILQQKLQEIKEEQEETFARQGENTVFNASQENKQRTEVAYTKEDSPEGKINAYGEIDQMEPTTQVESKKINDGTDKTMQKTQTTDNEAYLQNLISQLEKQLPANQKKEQEFLLGLVNSITDIGNMLFKFEANLSSHIDHLQGRVKNLHKTTHKIVSYRKSHYLLHYILKNSTEACSCVANLYFSS